MHNDRTTVGRNRGEKASAGDSYGTPDALYDSLNRVFQFTIDLAADHWNAKAPLYCTVEGTFGKCVRPEGGGCRGDHRTFGGEWGSHQVSLDCPGYVKLADADGLALDWSGERPFCNPPFSQVARWVTMFAGRRNVEGAPIAVCILPESRDTAWWNTYVRHKSIQTPQTPRTRFIHPTVECEPGCSLPKKPMIADPGDGPWGKGHALGKAATSPPGGIAVVEFRPDWLLA